MPTDAIDRLGTGIEACSVQHTQGLSEFRTKISALERGLDMHDEWQSLADGQMAASAGKLQQLDESVESLEHAVAELQKTMNQCSPAASPVASATVGSERQSRNNGTGSARPTY